MRLAFFGTPDFSCLAFAALLDAGHEIVAVYTRPPRQAGRGRRLRPSPVQALATQHRLCVRTPETLKDEDIQRAFCDLSADAAIVVAYGLLLPKQILDAPRLGCLNIHASLLPRWRGAAPIQRAIMEGDLETGITIMLMDEGLDTGPEILKRAIPIDPTATAGVLHDRLAELGGELIVEALEGLAARTLSPVAQSAHGATYAEKIERDAGRLDWRRPAQDLARLVRALNPRPGAWFEVRDERIKVLAARALDGGGAPGQIIADPLTVACGTGALSLERLQRPGRGAMDVADFQRGFSLPPGTDLT